MKNLVPKDTNDNFPFTNRWKEISWVKGRRFTLNLALGKGLRHLVEGETYFSKATVAGLFSNG